MHGLGGTSLRIDLQTGQITKTPTDPKLVRNWMGARGFISKILYDEVPRDADPLGPDNVFVMAPGILTGSFVPAGAKIGFGCISPATNGLADSSMGGHLGPELKYAGYDKIIFRGKSEKLVYLWIKDDKVELRDASHLKGKGAIESAELITKELGESEAQVGQGRDPFQPPRQRPWGDG